MRDKETQVELISGIIDFKECFVIRVNGEIKCITLDEVVKDFDKKPLPPKKEKVLKVKVIPKPKIKRIPKVKKIVKPVQKTPVVKAKTPLKKEPPVPETVTEVKPVINTLVKYREQSKKLYKKILPRKQGYAVDHIIPLSFMFSLGVDIELANSPVNLQYLRPAENNAKFSFIQNYWQLCKIFSALGVEIPTKDHVDKWNEKQQKKLNKILSRWWLSTP